jgi:VWFA-related protein
LLRNSQFCLLSATLLLFVHRATAQNGQAQPATSAAQQSAPAAELKIPVPLVVEDVTVLDRNDRPVPGLKSSDLTVTEDGKPVAVRIFEEHVPPAQPAAIPKAPDLGPNVFTNLPTALPGNSLYILLLDALNTPLNDQLYVRQQMLKYLKNLPPGMRVAVFGLGTRLFLLQGFTSNPEILEAAIDNKRSKGTSPLMDDPVSGAPVEQMSDQLQDMGNTSDPTTQMVIANLQQFEAETQTQQTRLRMIYTLQAMDELARYLAAFPGRKNLIWFSGSFPLNIFPDESLQDPFGPMADFEDDVRKTTEQMARSRVVVYPVDGRGLFVNPALSASQSGASLVRNPSAFTNSDRKFFEQTAAEHATMDMIAEETGGKAFYNTNGLKEAVQKVADIGDRYYTIAYTPSNGKLDGGYRRIAIKANQPGLHLEYRNGYFADDPNSEKRGQKVLPANPMTVAMTHGGPSPAQILFDAAVIPGEKSGDTITEGTKPDPKLMKPPYLTYTVQYLVDIRSAEFIATDQGQRHGHVEFATFLYNADGELVDSADQGATLDLTADKFAQFSKQGLLVRQMIDIPVKGEYFLRIGVHDLASDCVGAIEVPVAALKSRQQLIDAAKQAAAKQPQNAGGKTGVTDKE